MGIGFGVTHVSDFKLDDKSRTLDENVYDFPGHTVADISLYYRYKKFDITVKMNNIFDETYFRAVNNLVSIYPGKPRTYLAQLSYSF